jgi:hypothetical protein
MRLSRGLQSFPEAILVGALPAGKGELACRQVDPIELARRPSGTGTFAILVDEDHAGRLVRGVDCDQVDR